VASALRSGHLSVGVAGPTRVLADGGPHVSGSVGGAGLWPWTPPTDISQPMVDREKVLTVLHKRFPGATAEQMAAAANAIVGLEDDWEDVSAHEPEFGYHFSAQCCDICYLAEQSQRGSEFRLLRRRLSAS
jgi:hypothetical protein